MKTGMLSVTLLPMVSVPAGSMSSDETESVPRLRISTYLPEISAVSALMEPWELSAIPASANRMASPSVALTSPALMTCVNGLSASARPEKSTESLPPLKLPSSTEEVPSRPICLALMVPAFRTLLPMSAST